MPKLILVELNEIHWGLIEPLLEQGELPELAAMLRNGARAAPEATERPPLLEPWITWTSLHTGVPHEEHGISVLEPPPETVKHKRSWEYVAEAGKSYGVFATPNSWPPRDDAAFYVPGNFSQDTSTHPQDLAPIQDLNVTYSRNHNPLQGQEGASAMVRRGLALLRCGLRPATVARLAGQLAFEKLNPRVAWRKVALQPVVNVDFFEKLWRAHRPDFATFHSNHVAHFMHRYWRAHDPSAFPAHPPSQDEIGQYGGAITFGHRVADRVLGRIRRFADDDTVVAVASSMGQKPHIDERYADGKPATRVRDVERVLELLGVAGRAEALPMMAPQWNVEFADDAARDAMRAALTASHTERDGERLGPVLHHEEHGGRVTMTPAAPTGGREGLTAVFVTPAGETRLPWNDVFAQMDGTTKEGYHDPTGLLVLEGPGVRRGATAGACSNLDVLPTLLALMGVPVPGDLPGRVLDELLAPAPSDAAIAAPASL